MSWVSETLPKFLAAFEKRLVTNTNSKFVVGESLTLADFAFISIIFTLFYNELNDYSKLLKPAFESFPHLKAYAENAGKVFHTYLESRP